MSETIQRQRRKRKEKVKGKYRIKVRYNHHEWRMIETEDYGTFAEMYEKYHGKYTFWCGDLPPHTESDGTFTGFRLDSEIDPTHVERTLKRYGRHKCWIDPSYKFEGKTVCLVFNAQFGIGDFATVVGAAVAINTISDLTHQRYHREGIKHKHMGKRGDKLKVKVIRGKHSSSRKSGRWRTNRKTGRRFRA